MIRLILCASLGELPEGPAVFALCAADPAAEPYLSKTPNLRRRLMRFLRGPQPGVVSRRLQLAHLVDHIEYTVTGSDFESFAVPLSGFPARLRCTGRKNVCVFAPLPFLRMSVDNPYPRVYVTSKISKSAANALFGPFPSRTAAECYADEMLNLFLLRRCTEDLNPDPTFPGCVYSEMKKCLAPCYRGCSDERYKEESQNVFAFLSTRGASMIADLEGERDAASNAMEFERAAAIHQRMQKVQTVATWPVRQFARWQSFPASWCSRRRNWACCPVCPAARGVERARALFHRRDAAGERRSGSSSLFAHPVALEPVPLEGPVLAGRDVLESRLEEALLVLAEPSTEAGFIADLSRPPGAVHAMVLSAHGKVERRDDVRWGGWRGVP